MKKNKNFRLTAVLIALMLTFPYWPSAAAASAPNLRLTVADHAAVGGTVSVKIAGDNLDDLYAYELTLEYDKQALEYENVSYDLASGGFGLPVDAAQGKKFAYTKVGDTTAGTSGTHDLLTVTFKALRAGTAEVKLSGITLIDSRLQSVKLSGDYSASVSLSSGQGTGGDGSGGGTTSGSSSSQGNTAETGTFVTITPEMVSSAGSESVSLPFPEGASEIRIPVSVLKDMKGRKTEIQGEGFSLELPASEAALLAGRLDGGSGYLALAVRAYSAEETVRLLAANRAAAAADAVRVAGRTYGFTLSLGGAAGGAAAVSAFGTPLTLKLKGGSDSGSSLAGIYYIANDGSIEYAGGEWDGDTVSAPISHFSVYSVLKVTREFKDVPASHWAHEAVQVLAARGIAEGSENGLFEPGRSVTRAEFTAMLVRMLQLKGDGAYGSVSFDDVPAGAWYEDEVGAAYAAGLVTGRGGRSFAPSATLTRQEMAVMLAKANAKLGGSLPGADAELTFTDRRLIAAWAEEAVRSVHGLGIMQGRSGSVFAPAAVVNRAEAAQALYRMAAE